MQCPVCQSPNAADRTTCASCGAKLPQTTGGESPAAGGTPAAISSAAGSAPTGAPTATRPATDGAVAGLGDRLIATLLDTVVLAAAFVVVGSWAAARWGGDTAQGFDLTGRPALVVMVLTGITGFLYYWLLEATTGATFGKAIVGLRVRTSGGDPIGTGAAFVRNVMRIIDGIAVYLVGYLVAIFSKRRQRLGDHLAHTIVVQGPSGGIPRAAGLAALMVTVVGAGIGAYAIRRSAAQSAMATAAGRSTAGPASPVQIVSDARMIASDEGTKPSSGEPSATNAAPSGGKLSLQHPQWLDHAGGSPRSGAYKPGDEVFGAYEVTGASRDAQQQIDVTLQVQAVDPGGTRLHEPWTLRVHEANPSNTPVTASVNLYLPPFVPPGAYAFQITAHDAVANENGEFRLPFTVDAPVLAPAEKLEVRDFQFATAADGPPLSPAVFHAGQTVYFAFRVFGVHFQNDRPDLHIDNALLSPSGATVLGKQDWLQAHDEALSYHPTTIFFPIGSYVTLPADLPKGTYTQQFTISDKVANTSIVHRATFDVQ